MPRSTLRYLNPDFEPFDRQRIGITHDVARLIPGKLTPAILQAALPEIYVDGIRDRFLFHALQSNQEAGEPETFHIDHPRPDENPGWHLFVNLEQDQELILSFLDADPKKTELTYSPETNQSFVLGSPSLADARFLFAAKQPGIGSLYAEGILLAPSEVLHNDCQGKLGRLVAEYVMEVPERQA